MIDENDPGTVPMPYPIGFRIGYVRGQPDECAGQVDALRAAPCNEIYRDEGAGAAVTTIGRESAFKALRRGDTLVVTALDRLADSLPELVDVLASLEGRGIELIALRESIDTADVQPSLFQLARALAGAGQAYASPRRPRKGRRPRLSPADVAAARAMLADPKTTMAEVCRHYGVSRQTLHAHLGPRKGSKAQPEASRYAR